MAASLMRAVRFGTFLTYFIIFTVGRYSFAADNNNNYKSSMTNGDLMMNSSSPFDQLGLWLGRDTKRMSTASSGQSGGTANDEISQSSTIYFNNPHLLKGQQFFGSVNGGGDADEDLDDNGEANRGEDNYGDSGGGSGSDGGISGGPPYLRDEARTIASHLRSLCNEELGVTAMQAVFDSLPFVPAPLNADAAQEMASRMQLKLKKYSAALHRSKKAVENFHTVLSSEFLQPGCEMQSCCDFSSHRSTSFGSEHYVGGVLRVSSCSFVPSDVIISSASSFGDDNVYDDSLCPGRNLSASFEANAKELGALEGQYFLSTMGGSVIRHPAFPTDAFDGGCRDPDETRMREIFLSTVYPQSKYVIIMVDHGNALSNRQLSIAKAVAKTVLASLSSADYVTVFGLAGSLTYRPSQESCLAARMFPATLDVKLHFTRFIDGLTKAKDAANHSLGFLKAFEFIGNTLGNFSQPSINQPGMLIVYVSRGLLSYLTEARTIMETIADGNEKFNDRVVINTFTVIDDARPLMYEKNVLQDVADQNFKKYIAEHVPRQTMRGMMIAVNTTRNLGVIVGDPFRVLGLNPSKRTSFSQPLWDSVGKGLVLSLSVACFRETQLLGVVGLDARLADVIEDVVSYSDAGAATTLGSYSYAFVVDSRDGHVVFHPGFTQRIVHSNEQPFHTHIRQLENRMGFRSVWDKIRRMNSGKEVFISSHLNDSNTQDTVGYSWQKVNDTPYVLCVVTETRNEDYEGTSGVRNRNVLRSSEVATSVDVVYHRLDMLTEVKKCRHLKQLATSKAASLFLSSSCFYSPFEYLHQRETRRNVQGYMAYLSDNTKLIANPGLKSNVRSDVAALVNIVSEWKRQFLSGSVEQYIVRRFVATPRGVFQVYPGVMLEKDYNPTKRPWFTRALNYPGHVVLTAPYLDVGGAGYIVTVSHTVYEGKSAAMHGSKDAVVAVMGLDFTIGYFYKLLLKTMPVCARERISCFILDDMGYLIVHPGLIEPNGKGPVEQQHITHKEPLVANDILNHKGFVRKKLCNSFSDRTIQRFYKFNTSLDVTLTNLVHGEHCSKYHITSIPGTNVFLGIVNQTCDMFTAFCPCSMVDRLCLNCHRMEQSECECPCECPLDDVDLCSSDGDEMDGGTDFLGSSHGSRPSCLHFPGDGDDNPVRNYIEPSFQRNYLVDGLEYCADTKCPLRTSQGACFGVLGCEWCQLESDGRTPLVRPFCAEQRRCFGGVLGARTPYADEIVGLLSEEYLGMNSTPVGPVAGGIMGCFLVLALAVYCYRHHVHRSNGHHHYVPDNHMHMSQLDEIDENDSGEQAGTVGHSNVVLATYENVVNVSPYRVSTGYRRPAGGDSDHGYSTMTPHEDSEHMPYAEPLLLGRDKCRPAPPHSVTSGAGTSRASSPISLPQPLPLMPAKMQYQLNSPTPITYSGHPRTVISAMSPLLSSPSLDIDPSQTRIREPSSSLSSSPHRILASVQVHMVDTN